MGYWWEVEELGIWLCNMLHSNASHHPLIHLHIIYENNKLLWQFRFTGLNLRKGQLSHPNPILHQLWLSLCYEASLNWYPTDSNQERNEHFYLFFTIRVYYSTPQPSSSSGDTICFKCDNPDVKYLYKYLNKTPSPLHLHNHLNGIDREGERERWH